MLQWQIRVKQREMRKEKVEEDKIIQINGLK